MDRTVVAAAPAIRSDQCATVSVERASVLYRVSSGPAAMKPVNKG